MMSQWLQKNNLLYGFFCLLFIQCSYANPLFPPVLSAETAFVTGATYEGNQVNVWWHIAPQCYLYRESVKINVLSPNGEETPLLNETNLPSGQKIQDPFFGEQIIYRNTVNASVDLSPFIDAKSEQLTLHVHYQGCASSGFCYPPMTKSFTVTINNAHIEGILSLDNTLPKSIPVKTESLEEPPPPQTKSFLATVATFYFLGVLLSFTPCVLPMIPILLVAIVGQGHLNTRRAFTVSLCYVTSMALTYAVAGIIVATLGKNLQASLQKPLVLILFSALFLYLGFAQLGIGKISLPAKWRNWLNHSHMKQVSGSYLGAIIMGILATLIASPCVSVPMIGALSLITQRGDTLLGGCSLFAMGLGMGTLLLIIGTLEGRFLPKKGPWMQAINQMFALILFGLSLWLMDRLLSGPVVLALSGLLLLLGATWMGTFSLKPNLSGRLGALLAIYAGLLFWGSWHGGDDPLKPLSTNPWQISAITSCLPPHFEAIDSISELEKQQQSAKNEARPLMVVFHADWCLSCKHFERSVLGNNEVQSLLSNWKTVIADVTKYDDASKRLLKKFDLVGPPVVLFFNKDGNELTKFRLTGELSKQEFITLVNKVKKEM